MEHRKRFDQVMSYEQPDRQPVYYFGQWRETLTRWQQEGLESAAAIDSVVGLDPCWENGMWQCHSLVNLGPLSDREPVVLSETEDCRIVRNAIGEVAKVSKLGSSIPQHLEFALKPTRESWNDFKQFLNPNDSRRFAADPQPIYDQLNNRDVVNCFIGGSLFGWPRDWLGLEGISYLPYDEPLLFEEMLDYLTDYYIELNRTVLEHVSFDFVYIFEDCCGKNGPLFSPTTYERFMAKYYRRLTDFYHGMGVKYVLLDSDGKVDVMIPHWLDSGVDIIFPIEVGTWRADPCELRRTFGRQLRMMGGVDKHIIPKGPQAIRLELERLRPLVEEGGFIPLPDHRLPPDCSLEQFKVYIEIFKQVFNS